MSNAIQFEYTPDFYLAICLLTKYNRREVDLKDILETLKFLGIKYKYNESNFKEYLNKISNIHLSIGETKTIKKLYDVLNDYNRGIIDQDNYLHRKTWINDEQVVLAYHIDLLYKNYNKSSFNSFEATLKYIFRDNNNFEYNMDYERLINSIANINKDYYDACLSDYIRDNTLLDAIEMMEIETCSDLMMLNKEILYILFSRNIEEYTEIFEKLKSRNKENVKELLSLVVKMKEITSTNKSRDVIFRKRFGICCEEETLESIASNFGITRERVRQQEKKTLDHLNESYKKVFNRVLEETIDNQRIKDDYLSYNDVNEFIGDIEISEFLRVFIELLSDHILYDNKLSIFYYKEKKDTIISSRLNILPLYVSKGDLNELEDIDQGIVTHTRFYKELGNGGFLKSEVQKKDLYSMVIDELFPNGFKMDDVSMDKVIDLVSERFGIEPISHRALYGIIERCDYCHIDKGTIINRKFIAPLPEDLKNGILYYISQCDIEALYYHVVYEKFKKELNEQGIDNRYYLKGLIDLELPDEYKPQRDYISLGKNSTTGRKAINDIISSITGKIDIDFLKGIFPGISDSTFALILTQRNDVLRDNYGNSFTRVNYSEVDQQLDVTIKEEMENLFNKLDYPILTSSKIYSRMKIYHADLLDKVSFLNNHYIFFSYLEKRFNSYFYRRPYISKSQSTELSVNAIISNYVDSLDYFNNSIIDSFCTKMHLRKLYSYLDFIVEKSDKFVQVDIKNCIKKEKLSLDNKRLGEIKYEIDFYINSFGVIDTRTYNNFNGYPYLGYKWSKYLLAGIVRSYFGEQYTIEYTDTSYIQTDFIIRRA